MTNTKLNKILYGGPIPYHRAFEYKSLGELYLQRLRELGDRELLVDAISGQVVSGNELRTRSIRFARALLNIGITLGDRIFICSEDRMEFAYALLGAIYIGASVAFVEPNYAESQISHTIHDTQPKVAFCSQMSVDKIREIANHSDSLETVILFGDNCMYDDVISSERFLNGQPIDETNEFVSLPVNMSETVAIILRTSGTTNLPKGILITQTNLLLSALHYTPLSTISEPIAFSVVSWVRGIGVKMLFKNLLNNVKTVFAPHFKRDFELYRAIETYKVNIVYTHPALMALLANSPTVDKFDLSSAKLLYTGGSALKKELNEAVLKRLPGAVTRSIYGMVELSYVTQQNDDSVKDGSVGVLQPGVFGKVLDIDTGDIVGPYAHGELCFKGEVLMKSYVGDIESSSFIDEKGWYHSGDIGYYDDDGEWFLVGRKKDLIHYNGRKISPSTIETILVQHPKVKEAGVIGVQSEYLDEVPVAFIVKEESENVSDKEVIDFLLGKSVPQIRLDRVIFVKKLPISQIGKLLRNFMREYCADKPSHDIEKTSPFYLQWYNNNFNQNGV